MSTLPTLYQITDQLMALAEALNDPEVSQDEVLAELEKVEGQLQEKAVNIATLIKNQEALAAQIREAELQMAKRRQAIEAKAQRVREYLLGQMQKARISRIESPHFRLSITKNPPSVIVDESQLPDQYWRVKTIMTPDKALIKEDLEAGYEVRGAYLDKVKQRLNIK